MNACCKKTGKSIFTDEQLKTIEIDETFYDVFFSCRKCLFYNLAVRIGYCNLCLLENVNECFSLGISVNEQDMSILTKL